MVKIAESIAQLINMKRKRHYVNGIILNGTKFEFFQRAAKGAIKQCFISFYQNRAIWINEKKKKNKYKYLQLYIKCVGHN